MAHGAKPLPLLRLAGITEEVGFQAAVAAARGPSICAAACRQECQHLVFKAGWRLANEGVIVGEVDVESPVAKCVDEDLLSDFQRQTLKEAVVRYRVSC